MSAPRAGLRPARPPRGSRQLGAARRFLEGSWFEGRRDGWVSAGVLGLLAAVLWAWTSSDALRFDDAGHILFASQHPWWGMLVDPELAYRFSRNNYTPLNTLIYELGLAVFGDAVRGYYVLHVAVLWAAAWATWLLLRRGLGAGTALATAVLFMVSPATWYVAGQLTVHHYVLGLLFAVLHTHAWLDHLVTRRTASLALSMACYLVAVLCKEIYVLWPGALLFLPVAGWRERVRSLAWHAPVVALYAFLRLRTLGGIGGYSAASQPGEWWQWLQGLSVVPRVMLGTTVVGILGMGVLLLLGLVALRHRRAALFAAVALLLGLAPLVMLVKYPGLVVPDRYFFLPWWLLATGVGLSALLVRRPALWGAACMVMVVAAASHTHREARVFMSALRDFDALNGLLATPSPHPRVVLLPDIFPISYVRQVSMRYALFLSERRGIRNLLVTDPADAAWLAASRDGVWVLDRGQHRMERRDLSSLVPGARPGTADVAWTHEAAPAVPEQLPGYFLGRMGGRVTSLVQAPDRLQVTVSVPALGGTAYLKALAPGVLRISALPTAPARQVGMATFAFELQPENPAATDAMLRDLCLAVSFDGESVLMIEGVPSARCALFLRRSRVAEEL